MDDWLLVVPDRRVRSSQLHYCDYDWWLAFFQHYILLYAVTQMTVTDIVINSLWAYVMQQLFVYTIWNILKSNAFEAA